MLIDRALRSWIITICEPLEYTYVKKWITNDSLFIKIFWPFLAKKELVSSKVLLIGKYTIIWRISKDDTNNVGWHGQTRLSVQCIAICWKHGQTKFVHATTHVNEKAVGFLSFKTQPNLLIIDNSPADIYIVSVKVNNNSKKLFYAFEDQQQEEYFRMYTKTWRKEYISAIREKLWIIELRFHIWALSCAAEMTITAVICCGVCRYPLVVG